MTRPPQTTLHGADEGTGPALVLLHPVGLDHRCWDAVAALLGRDRRILRPDLPGHGQSPALPDPAALRDYAAAVAAWLTARDAPPATVVGLSFGGMVAQTLALEHPQAVSALVVAGCGAGFPDDDVRAAIAARGTDAVAGGMEAVLETTLARWFTPAFRDSGGDSRTCARLLADDPAGWAAAWQAISGLDTLGRLGEIRVPALCIAGALDPAAPPTVLQSVATAIPGARLRVLPEAPHMMQIETPEAFAGAVTEFISTLD